MLTQLRIKIGSLIGDYPAKSDYETFTYVTSSIFTISESNIVSITKVLKNGSELGSGQYSYDSTTNKIEIVASLTSGDIIEVDYTYTKYSDTELNGYIRSALVWIGVYSTSDFELEADAIEPTPTNRELDLISLVSSILIKPDYMQYSLPNLRVVYPRTMTKEKRIEVLIQRFNMGGSVGVMDVLVWNFNIGV